MQSKRLWSNKAEQKKKQLTKGILSTHSDKAPHIIVAVLWPLTVTRCRHLSEDEWHGTERKVSFVFFPPPLRGWPGTAVLLPVSLPTAVHTLDTIQPRPYLTMAACHGCKHQHVDRDRILKH